MKRHEDENCKEILKNKKLIVGEEVYVKLTEQRI